MLLVYCSTRYVLPVYYTAGIFVVRKVPRSRHRGTLYECCTSSTESTGRNKSEVRIVYVRAAYSSTSST